MKHKILGLTLGVVCCFNGFAGDVVDVYGTSQSIGDTLLEKYGKQVSQFEVALNEKGQVLIAHGSPEEKEVQHIFKQREKLINTMKKEFSFSYVDFQTVIYPDKPDLYTTVEVVPSTQPERMRFTQPTHYPTKKVSKHDLIDKMTEYQRTGFNLMLSKKMTQLSTTCPVFHCAFGFDFPELKPYLAIFNEGAIKQRPLILNTLKQDRDPERRESAAMLVGHFNNPRDIIQVMSEYIQDASAGIRNNAMRVMAATMEKAKIYDVNLKPVLEMLDSPSVTDRNKALYVVSVAAKDKTNHPLIVTEGASHIIQLLALKQLNNHDIAYLILKLLSGKDLGEHNIMGWQQWLAFTLNTTA